MDSLFISNLYEVFFNRKAKDDEVLIWQNRIKEGLDYPELIKNFMNSSEYLEVKRAKNLLFVSPGHFYSPIVDTSNDNIKKYLKNSNILNGIDLNIGHQLANWNNFLPYLTNLELSKNKVSGLRYYYDNFSFGFGDACIYSAFLSKFRPKKIIEIGSGFSSACLLDNVDKYLANERPSISFIEPYPSLLLSLLTSNDLNNIELYESDIQSVTPPVFNELEENDILFIDSTHVLKTASDVCWELFEILPTLKKGVLIHFHDIFWPFEYPNSWIFNENRSWNEIYALRAFLMYNHEFRIEFFNDFFAQTMSDVVKVNFPDFLINTGGSFWIRKIK